LGKKTDGVKVVADNRQAGHNYHLMDRFEAGLVLTGTEVKSARTGKVQLRDSYADIVENEAWLMNAHFSPYSHGNITNHNPTARRKLLLHRREIDKLSGKLREKGLTLIPTRIYLKDSLLKCELALAKGKKLHDKRDAEKKREQEAEAKAELVRRKAKSYEH